MKQALLYLFTFLCIQVVSSFLVSAVFAVIAKDPSAVESTWVTLIAMVLFSVVTVIVFLRMKWASGSPSYLRSRPWAVLFWSVVAALGAIVPSLFLQGLLPEFPVWMQEIADESDRTVAQLMRNPGGYIVLALLPPVVEEMVFRGAVLRSLLRWKPQRQWLMITLTAFLFALVHLNPAQMPHAFLIGLLLGWMYARTGSIVPGIAFHWANNTAAYVMFHVYQNPQTLNDIVGPGMQRVLMAVGFSLCILLPALYQLSRRMKKAICRA